MGRNVLTLLEGDHRRIEAALALTARERARGSRLPPRDAAVALVVAHAFAVEATVHPFLLRRSPGVRPAVDAARRHSWLLVEAAGTLADTPPGDEIFGSCCGRVTILLAEHADSERILLAPLGSDVGVVRLRELGAAYVRARETRLGARTARGAGTTPRRFDASRADLYERARRKGVEGRSSMSRDQLIDALGATAPRSR